MSDRLRWLLEEIERAPSMRPACERWVDMLRSELAEREASPVAIEPAIAEILREMDADVDIARGTQPGWPETRGARVLAALRIRLRDLALHGTRPATHEEALGVALDLAEERGEYSEALRGQVARHIHGLKLCTPWRWEPDIGERQVMDVATGALLVALEEGEPERYRFRVAGSWVDSRDDLTLGEAEHLAGEWLRGNGWVQVPDTSKEAP